MKKFSLIMLIASCILASLCGSYPVYRLEMVANVGEGEGTSDQIEDIPGFTVNGVTIYLGYLEGDYLPAVSIGDLKALNNSTSPADLSLVEDDELEETATIYVGADSNVTGTSSVAIRFNPGIGWSYDDESVEVEPVSIVSDLQTSGVTSAESNVTARILGDDIILLMARPGAPKNEDSRIVAYNVLSWPNDGRYPSGSYSATVSVEVVDGN